MDNKDSRKACIEIDAFRQLQPVDNAYLAVGVGPYCIDFRVGHCSKCGEQAYVREYSVKILALNNIDFPALSADDRAAMGQMDAIALAMYVTNAGVWVCSNRPEKRIGLRAIHSALPKWIYQSTSTLIFKHERHTSTPFARLGYTQTAVGNKTLVNRCPHCESDLPAFHSYDAMATPMRFMLLDDKNEPMLYSWPVVVSHVSQA